MAADGAMQTSYRVRDVMESPLNRDVGWAAGADRATTVGADLPFRIRFEVEAADDAAIGAREGGGFRLQVRRNGGVWEDLVARDFPYPDEISTPPVSIVEARGYAGGEATADLLSGSELPFEEGVGVSLDSAAPAWSATSAAQGEWEWPLVIRRYADGAVTNDEGDTFDFRMRTAAGAPVASASAFARVRLAVPERLLGGTFVETPGRLGPWQSSDGDLHFVMEPAETDNVLMAVRSPDGGRSWAEVDGVARPTTGDLEGVATGWHEGRVHILHQISDSVLYHIFRTADTPEGAGWEIRDEFVAAPGEPPVQVAALELLPDGRAVAVYGGPMDLRIRVRSPDGPWGDEALIRGQSDERVSGPQTVLLPGGDVALAYTTQTVLPGEEDEGVGAKVADDPNPDVEGRAWLSMIDPAGSPGPPLLVSNRIGAREEESGAFAPLVYLADTQEVLVLYREADGHLWERRRGPGGSLTAPVRATRRPVVQNAVDSDQVGADAVVHEGVVHLLFIDDATRAIHHTRRLPNGEWTGDEVVVQEIDGQWVRGAIVRGSGGEPAYAFVYDAGSQGGSGMNRYGELPLGSSVR